MCNWKLLRDVAEGSKIDISSLRFSTSDVFIAAMSLHIYPIVSLGMDCDELLNDEDTVLEIEEETISEMVSCALGNMAAVDLDPVFAASKIDFLSKEVPHPAGLAIGWAIYQIMAHDFSDRLGDTVANAIGDVVATLDLSTNDDSLHGTLVIANAIIDNLGLDIVGAIDIAVEEVLRLYVVVAVSDDDSEASTEIVGGTDAHQSNDANVGNIVHVGPDANEGTDVNMEIDDNVGTDAKIGAGTGFGTDENDGAETCAQTEAIIDTYLNVGNDISASTQ